MVWIAKDTVTYRIIIFAVIFAKIIKEVKRIIVSDIKCIVILLRIFTAFAPIFCTKRFSFKSLFGITTVE